MADYWQLQESVDQWQLEETTDLWELEESGVVADNPMPLMGGGYYPEQG